MVEFVDGYFITEDGRVFSTKKYNKATELKPQGNKHGYAKVLIYSLENPKGKLTSIHRLVAKTFIDNPNNFYNIYAKILPTQTEISGADGSALPIGIGITFVKPDDSQVSE